MGSGIRALCKSQFEGAAGFVDGVNSSSYVGGLSLLP